MHLGRTFLHLKYLTIQVLVLIRTQIQLKVVRNQFCEFEVCTVESAIQSSVEYDETVVRGKKRIKVERNIPEGTGAARSPLRTIQTARLSGNVPRQYGSCGEPTGSEQSW